MKKIKLLKKIMAKKYVELLQRKNECELEYNNIYNLIGDDINEFRDVISEINKEYKLLDEQLNDIDEDLVFLETVTSKHQLKFPQYKGIKNKYHE